MDFSTNIVSVDCALTTLFGVTCSLFRVWRQEGQVEILGQHFADNIPWLCPGLFLKGQGYYQRWLGQGIPWHLFWLWILRKWITCGISFVICMLNPRNLELDPRDGQIFFKRGNYVTHFERNGYAFLSEKFFFRSSKSGQLLATFQLSLLGKRLLR